jgi:hypothetical protein
MSTVDPSQGEIDLLVTASGEMGRSVKNINTHAREALKGAHSDIIGSIPAMKFYNDPTGHPEILNDPLYDKYKMVRRTFAQAYLTGIIAKNAARSKELYDTAIHMLEKLVTDYNNFLISGTDTGIEGSTANVATVKTSPKTYPNNPNAVRFRPTTMR